MRRRGVRQHPPLQVVGRLQRIRLRGVREGGGGAAGHRGENAAGGSAGAEGAAPADGACVQVLNNPPEDAPRKAGIFPKTRCGKPVHLPASPPEDEEKKKRKKKKKKDSKEQPTEAAAVAASEPKRRRSAAAGAAAAKPSEKKRRRSQTTDESEGEAPAKIRRTRASEEAHEDAAETGESSEHARIAAGPPEHASSTRWCLQAPASRAKRRKTAKRTETTRPCEPRGNERRSTRRS